MLRFQRYTFFISTFSIFVYWYFSIFLHFTISRFQYFSTFRFFYFSIFAFCVSRFLYFPFWVFANNMFIHWYISFRNRYKVFGTDIFYYHCILYFCKSDHSFMYMFSLNFFFALTSFASTARIIECKLENGREFWQGLSTACSNLY